MKEVCIQHVGKGLMDIKRDSNSAIVFHKQQPRVVAWEMNHNTLLDFLLVIFLINSYSI